jgi:hypothetical protein
MSSVVRIQRAESDTERLDEEIAALIKGMLKRGDKQSDIAACFLINGGRISEINQKQRFADVAPAAEADLPPRAPYPSPYELWEATRETWRVRVALEKARDAIHDAMVAVRKVEQR